MIARTTLRSLPLWMGAAVSFAPASVSAQWPAEVVGDVVEAGTGAPVPYATIAIDGGREIASDGVGRFRVRLTESRRVSLRVSRIGYRARSLEAEPRSGQTTRVVVVLEPEPLPIDPLIARVEPIPGSVFRIDRETIERSSAASAGDLVRRVPGVVVRRRGPGGPETPSIRGSAPDAVLVLIDGIEINDPVTGAADLSSIRASLIESIAVAPGAGSARYGPRARGGVIAIETRHPAVRTEGRLIVGSLGRRTAGGAIGRRAESWTISGDAEYTGEEGDFEYRLPAAVGGIEGRRSNADLERVTAQVGVEGRPAGDRVSLRVGIERARRGLPGKAFAPATAARQSADGVRATASFRRERSDFANGVTFHAASRDLRHRDPEPPIGPAYDDATRVAELGATLSATRRFARPLVRDIEGRFDVRRRAVESDALGTGGTKTTHDAGVSAAATIAHVFESSLEVEINGRARYDRDGVTGRGFLTHGADVAMAIGRFDLLASHRSAFNPPALGDLFFDASIGVAPNPSLRPERVRGEVELRVAYAGSVGRPASAGLAIYRADVDDMIEWAPDFRFVWSPRNFDVDRRGAELWLRMPQAAAIPAMEISYGYARARYAPGERRGDAQIVYRPEHTATVRLDWSMGGWRTYGEARFTGSRTTAPTDHNRLPGFWEIDLGIGRRWVRGPLEVESRFDLEHVNDQTRSLIFGFPEPGRRVRLGFFFRPNPQMKGGTP